MGRKKKVKAISSKEVSDNEPENDGNDDEITEKKVSKTRNRGKSNVSYKKLGREFHNFLKNIEL